MSADKPDDIAEYRFSQLEKDINDIKTLMQRLADGEVWPIKVIQQRLDVLESEVARLRAVDNNKSIHSWVMLGATAIACGCTVLGTLWQLFK